MHDMATHYGRPLFGYKSTGHGFTFDPIAIAIVIAVLSASPGERARRVRDVMCASGIKNCELYENTIKVRIRRILAFREWYESGKVRVDVAPNPALVVAVVNAPQPQLA